METKPFKVMEWLRTIRDNHYEMMKNKTWQEDHLDICNSAKETYRIIQRMKSQNASKTLHKTETL